MNRRSKYGVGGGGEGTRKAGRCYPWKGSRGEG